MNELGPWLRVCARRLAERGCILFRGFGVLQQAAFRELVSIFADSHLSYQIGAVEPPGADRGHRAVRHERTYGGGRPIRIWFCCTEEARAGARIALADGRDVFRRLPTEVRRRWAERGLMYVRYLGGELDVPWSRAFATSDWSQVESRCRGLGIVWEWKNGGVLRLSRTCAPMATHPGTLDRVWFNDAHLCHPGALETKRGVSVLKAPKVKEPSLQVYHADGSAIRKSDLALITAAYEASKVVIRLEPGDVLMLDNRLTAHGHDGDVQLELAKEYASDASSWELDPMWW